MHRDLKPHNILMTGAGNIKVVSFLIQIDFGDAKSIDEKDEEPADAPQLPGETGSTGEEDKKEEEEEDKDDGGMDFEEEVRQGMENVNLEDKKEEEDEFSPFDDLARKGT